MKINLQGVNLEITKAIEKHIVKKITNLGKVLSKIEKNGGEVLVSFEVSKDTNSHRTGDLFEAHGMVTVGGKKFDATSKKKNLYKAIDNVKDSLFREIRKDGDRKKTLFTRGARSVKKMLKGLSSRKP